MQGQLRYVLQYAVLAPSTHNTQPWLFQVSGSSAFLYADRSRALAVVDPHVRSLVMSCGAAQYNYEAALKAYGFEFRSSLFPEIADPDLLVRTDVLGRTHSLIQTDVLSAIRERRTVRTGFHASLTDEGIRNTLSLTARTEAAELQWLGRDEIHQLAHAAEGQPGLSDNRLRELDAWRHPNRTRTRDGLPGENAPSFSFFGEPDEDVSLAILTTRGDRMASWLRAGKALQAVLLSATSQGVRASMHAIDPIRTQLAGMTATSEIPQLLIRFGYSDPPRVTNRRTLVDVMLHPGYAP